MGRLRTGERVLLLHLGELVAEDDLGLTGAGANLLDGEGNLVVFVQAGPEKICDFVDVVLLDGHDHGIALEGGERLAVAHVSGHHQTKTVESGRGEVILVKAVLRNLSRSIQSRLRAHAKLRMNMAATNINETRDTRGVIRRIGLMAARAAGRLEGVAGLKSVENGIGLIAVRNDVLSVVGVSVLTILAHRVVNDQGGILNLGLIRGLGGDIRAVDLKNAIAGVGTAAHNPVNLHNGTVGLLTQDNAAAGVGVQISVNMVQALLGKLVAGATLCGHHHLSSLSSY